MKITKTILLAAAVALLGHSNAFADAVLSVVPSSGFVNPGQIFTVAIDVTGPTVIHSGTTYTSDVTDLNSFQFDVAYNCTLSSPTAPGCSPGASILNAISVSEGAFLPQGGANPTFFEPGSIDNTNGEISLIGDVGLSGVTGSGDLVDITFQALTAGTTNIAILANSDLQLYDSNFDPIVVDNSVTTSPDKQTFPTNQSLSASVTAVPEPASIDLMLLGGAGLLFAIANTGRLRPTDNQ